MVEVNDGLPDGAHFALRVGVNTGEVLAGAVGDAYTVTGDTVSLVPGLKLKVSRTATGQIEQFQADK